MDDSLCRRMREDWNERARGDASQEAVDPLDSVYELEGGVQSAHPGLGGGGHKKAAAVFCPRRR